MSNSSLPYITSPGNIDKALRAIKSAAVPEKVNGDFVKTILKIPGGSGDQVLSFLKKLGLANTDGSPSERYRTFRNPTTSGQAIAEAMRYAYQPLFQRNEYVHEVSDSELLGYVVEVTGQAHDSNPVKLIVSCFKHLKSNADFSIANSYDQRPTGEPPVPSRDTSERSSGHSGRANHAIGLNLGYTINLNLPATSDPRVFDAIFRSLKENLLREDDA